MKKLITIIFLLSLCCVTSAAKSYSVKGNYVTIVTSPLQAKSPTLMRLQVINSKIVRVEASVEKDFPDKNSLIILPQSVFKDFKVSEKQGKVVVSTQALRAEVDTRTAKVDFFDRNGKPLLLGDASQPMLIEPYRVPKREIGVDADKVPEAWRNGFSWTLRFNSSPDEAFYGLGQHQSEELNMKGRNEDLFQYNTKVSVPFVVSNKGYGLLWDSYSYCRFGNPNDYQQLNRAFTLYNREGRKGSLTGVYNGKNGEQLVRDEDSIYYEHAHVIGNLPKDFSLKGSNVVYEGFIEAPTTSTYHFILYYAGYVKVWIGDRQVVAERWRTAWNPNSWKFEVPLEKGKRTPLRIEWLPDGDVSYCGLRAAVPQSSDAQNQLCIWSEMAKDVDYYFIAGANADEVIAGYRTLTGKAQVMPRWAMGFWQSRERYKTSQEVEQTLAEFRRRHIPVDNIVQDWNYWADDSWGSHEFEQSRYPNPQAMLDNVHKMHGRFMISVWPKFYHTTDNYKALDSNGWMYHQAVVDSIRDWVGPGYIGSFYDAYAAGARKMFWQQMDCNLYSKYRQGIDSWWMDASEPNVRDCTPMWYRKALCGPTALGTSTKYFNAYSIVNADAIYNGQRSVNPNTRVFLLTRSGFAGEQRFSTATWSGDIGTRWEDMRAQMTAGMNFSISGIPFWGMDQGGFCVEDRYVKAQQIFNATGEENSDLKEWRELQTRWHQFGCFVPLFRTHGQWPTREVWNIAPENHPAYKSIVDYNRLRYRLMPYLYSMAGWVHFADYTMMRPLVMDFAGDAQALDIKDQWMFGPSLMACPVSRYEARSRNVYLPAGKGWYDFYTGVYHTGAQTIVADAPYSRIPVYVPEGSILPFGPEIEWCDQKPAELINLYVYAGGDAEFMLYEDEDTNYNYEKGKYATIDIKWNDAKRTLTFGNRKGEFDGMLKQRRFNVVLVTPDNAKALNLDSPEGVMVNYDGNKTSITL